MGYENFHAKNEISFAFFYSKLTLKQICARQFTEFGPMIYFTYPMTHMIYMKIAVFPFFIHDVF